MKVLEPIIVTESMLDSSTVAENDYAEWSSTTSYAVGDKCIKSHRIWESVQASNLNNDPLTAGATWWTDRAPTNRWAMFDDKIGTATTGTDEITVVMHPGGIGGLALVDVSASQIEITLKETTGGTVVYHRVIDLDGTIIQSVYDWFYAPYEPQTTAVITDIPYHFTSGELTISLTGTGPIACGVCKFGPVHELGLVQDGASSGILIFSKKERDLWGNLQITKRDSANRMNLELVLDISEYARVHKRLKALDSVSCIWVGSEQKDFEPLVTYGIYRDFSITVKYASKIYCSIEIEGLI